VSDHRDPLAPSSESNIEGDAASRRRTDIQSSNHPSGLPSALRALRHRNFRLFFAGQLVSMIGTWMQSVAQSWLVYSMTDSATLLGAVGFAGQIPVFLFAPLGGALADRYSRHRIIVVAQCTAMTLAFVLAFLTLTGRVEVWHVFILASTLGMVNAFDLPARQSFLFEMVGRQDLINAIALNSSIVNGARMLGPAIAGVVVAAVGEGWCFLANAVSYLAVIACLLIMTVPPRAIVHDPRSAVANILAGFGFVARTPPVRALVLLLGLVSLTGMPYTVLMPIFAADILDGGPRGLGFLMGAAGIGALSGAISLTLRKGLRGLARVIALASTGFGLSLILFSLSRNFWLSVALLIPAGFSMMVQMASSNTLIQSMVPDHLRGRVMAVYSMMFMGMAPFGAMLAGVLAEYIGAPSTVAIGGMVCMFGGATFGLFVPTLRAQARELIVAQQLTAGEPAEEVTASTVVPGPKS
jgi:MFS family permease